MIREDYEYIQTKLRRVRDLKGKKKLKEAMEELTKVMEDFPNEPLLMTELADCFRLNGNPEEAKTLALEALEKAPDNQEGHIVLGNMYLEERSYERALDHFETAARIKRTGYVISRMIRTLIDLERFDDAKDLIREELIGNPDNPVILKYKAQVLAKEGAYREAAEVYKRIYDMDPDDDFSYKELLRLKSMDRKPADVSREIKGILKVSKAAENPHLHSELGLNLKRAGKYEEAIAEFQNALALSPENNFILTHLGFCYAKLQMFKEVVETLSTPFIENPKDVYIKSSLMAAVKNGKQWEDLGKILKRAMERHPQEKSLWGLLKRTEKEMKEEEG
jgi:tetratricopeptide (TPR) repeat protein